MNARLLSVFPILFNYSQVTLASSIHNKSSDSDDPSVFFLLIHRAVHLPSFSRWEVYKVEPGLFLEPAGQARLSSHTTSATLSVLLLHTFTRFQQLPGAEEKRKSTVFFSPSSPHAHEWRSGPEYLIDHHARSPCRQTPLFF